jgi:GNAT superfamily N-acetyltransferase
VTEVRVVPPDETVALRQRVLRPHQSVEELRAQGDGAPQVAVYLDGVVVACASVRPEPMPGDPRDGDWRLRGMASAPDVRGQGYGAAALQGAVEYATERGARRLWCNARSAAVGFYERYGWRTVGEEFHLDPIGPHYVMVRSTSGST